MKLSMWMIANRLMSLDLDLETNISENAPAVLKSARRAYATNCVHVYQAGDSVVCDGEGDFIRFRNGTEAEVFEVIQGVFDYYEDWLDSVTEAARAREYPLLIQRAWQAFRNPLVLMDGDNKVLGITRRYGPEELDAEWEYLCRFGYSSLNSLQNMRRDPSGGDLQSPGIRPYRFTEVPQIKFSGLTCNLYSREIFCGNLVLLSKERPLNTGDRQLLQRLAGILEPVLGQESQERQERFLANSNVLYHLISGEPCEEEKLERQLRYRQWKRDGAYQLALLELSSQEEERRRLSFMNMLARSLPSHAVLYREPYVILLSNREFAGEAGFRRIQNAITAANPVRVGFSLPCRGLEGVPYLFSQAEAALRFGRLYHPDRAVFRLAEYAVPYMLTEISREERLQACCPAVRRLWEEQQEKGSKLFQTLKCYLDRECSVARTAEALFAHRNTVAYRIRKIQEQMPEDLQDPETRAYIGLSIRVLELTERLKEKNHKEAET